MGDSKNLSYATSFNHQKILINDTVDVVIPVSGASPDQLTTVITGQATRPTAKVYVEFSGTLCPAYMSTSATFNAIGKSTAFFCFFDANNDLYIQSFSFDTYTATLHYRLYLDGRPS